MNALYELVDHFKGLLTELAFHVATIVMVVVCNVVWFAFLFWVIGVWLDG